MRTVKAESASGLPHLINIAATGITFNNILGTGIVATVAASVPHRLAAGDKIQVSGVFDVAGASQPAYEGTFTVRSVTDATHFTYLLKQSPTNAATTVTQVRHLLPSTEYDPFAVVRNNRLMMEAAVPDASLYISDAAAHDGNWTELVALADCIVAELTSLTLSGFAAGMPIPKGLKIKGSFTHIKLTSGSLLANA